MLIFDKNKQYINLLENGFEKYPNKRDLLILCEHWLKEEGCEITDLKDNIIRFCTKWNSQFNVAKSENLIISVLKEVEKRQEGNLVFEFNSTIVLYQNEINTIKALKEDKLQKVAFVILCLAKWRNVDYIYINSESTIKVKDIFELAKVKGTCNERVGILHQLNEAGFIDVQLKPILKLFIPCISSNAEEDVQVKSFKISDELIIEWLKLIMPTCERCGNPFIKNNNKQKYCKECAKIVSNAQHLEMMRKKIKFTK